MKRSAPFVALLAAGFAPAALGVDLVDDFDGSTDFTSRTFTPVTGGDTSLNGLFGVNGSRFDRFGIANRTVGDTTGDQGLPFDVIDESVAAATGGSGVFANDEEGIIRSTKTDNFVILTDTNNNDNPDSFGRGLISWTFDISGMSNVNLSVDMAAIGDFEDSDIFAFDATIDGNPTQFDVINTTVAPEVGGNKVQYSITNEAGNTFDRYDNPFFSDDDWNALVNGTPPAGISFAASDANMDGLDDTLGIRVYQDGGFTDFETNPYQDPLVATTANGTTQLNNEFQTVSAPITGTGSTLTLDFFGFNDGSVEYFVMDNVRIFEESAGGILGDYNDNGLVEQGDLNQVLNNWGTDFASVSASWINQRPTEGIVDQAELNVVLNRWGSDTAPDFSGSAVPEPASLALLGLGALALRRRG